MRIALLSDIHGNREALDACLAHARRQGVDRWVFLGDLVGYGADPNYVIDRVRKAVLDGALCVLGNHDIAAVNCDTEHMNDYARAAIEWTHAALDAEGKQWLAQRPMTVVEEDRLYVHAEASHPEDWNYITDIDSAERSLVATTARLTFCGHVHRPQLYHMAPQRPPKYFAPVSGAPAPLMASRKWLCVAGSVGQPRDQNPAAAWCLLDTAKNEIVYHRVGYDVDTAAAKIRTAGLPQILAARLFIGR